MRWRETTPGEFVIRPSHGWRALDVAELWRHRALFGAFVRRDITLRYRQTALGVAWVVLQPLIAAGVFSFVFGQLAHLSSEGVPYIVFSFAGMLVWNVFSTALSAASNVLVGNSALVSKVYFPRLLLPLSLLGSRLVDLGITFTVLVLMMPIYGVGFTWRISLFPLVMLGLFILTLGPSLLAASLAVRYRDIQYIVPVVVQMLLFLSPVAYAVGNVTGKAKVFYRLNPLVGFLAAARWSLLGLGSFPWASVAYATGVGVVLLGGAAAFFRRSERWFADVI